MRPRLRVAVRLRIRRARFPRLVARLTRPRDGVEPPRLLARLGVVRGDEPADAAVPAGGADDHLVLDGQRRQGQGVRQVLVGHLDVPQFGAGGRIDRHDVRVERAHEHAVAEHRHAAVVRPAAGPVVGRRRIAVDPEHTARPGVERDDVVRPLRYVHHAVDHNRRCLPGTEDGRLVHPLQLQVADVGRRNLVQFAIALAEVAAGIGQPVVRLARRLPQACKRHLRRQPVRDQQPQRSRQQAARGETPRRRLASHGG